MELAKNSHYQGALQFLINHGFEIDRGSKDCVESVKWTSIDGGGIVTVDFERKTVSIVNQSDLIESHEIYSPADAFAVAIRFKEKLDLHQ